MTARGNRRELLFFEDPDRLGFLGMEVALPERFGIEVHASVLTDNPYHLRLRTPEPNLSQAIQRINVSYGTRWNGAHRLSGHDPIAFPRWAEIRNWFASISKPTTRTCLNNTGGFLIPCAVTF